MMLFSRYRRPIMVMSSRHRDGELMVSTYRRFGVDAARGSSSKGATGALREFIRAAQRGSNLVFTPDGPKGPPRVAKSGVVLAAQATGNAIIPVVFIARRKRSLRSWDSFQVPLPFSRGLFLYGDPIAVPRRLSDEEVEQYRRQVEDALNGLVKRGEGDFEALWREAGTGGR
jgi:lysophospholipid acyltransferase (LPLAT)-like uncharacterized protein